MSSQQGPVGRKRVTLGRNVNYLREVLVDGGAVVALEVVLDQDLPVALDLPLELFWHRLQLIEGEAVAFYRLLHRCQFCERRLGVGIEVDKQ